jgi:uncharacterized protein (TIGR02391 family)
MSQPPRPASVPAEQPLPVGHLTDPAAEAGEKEAMSSLFASALGVFKNPSSHRTVNYDDPLLAAEAVLLADLLLRLLARLPD